MIRNQFKNAVNLVVEKEVAPKLDIGFKYNNYMHKVNLFFMF